MADLIAALRAGGNIIPEIVVEVARIERCDPALPATICQNESYGGRNVWGSDGVPTGGTYTKGGAVTRANYEAYRAYMRAGTGRRQGVGPAQCTSAEFQDRADANGGCWDPTANLRAGTRGMADRIARYGVQQGARRYNGSGPAAEAYGSRFAERFALWQRRLSGLAVPAGVTAPAAGASGFRADYGDVGPHVHALAVFLNRNFGLYSDIDIDPDPARQRYGPQTVRVVKEYADRSRIPADGRNVGPKLAAALAANGFRP